MERNEYQEAKHTKFIYSSKRRIQRIVLQSEKSIAEAIYNYIQFNHKDQWFENNFAFSCWKFSKIAFEIKADHFWCDTIYFEDFHIENNRTFVFNGHAWIGLSSKC